MLDIDEDNQDNRSEQSDSDTASDSTTSASDSSNKQEEATSEDWDQQIPEDLPVDSNWDDVYQSLPAATPAPSGDLPDFESHTSSIASIHDHLLWQLNLTPMSDTDRIIAITLIDSVDDDGYLKGELDQILEHVKPGAATGR